MSDVLAIVGPAESDSELIARLARSHAQRVTVLVEDRESRCIDWAVDDSERGQALRGRLAMLLREIEVSTGAAVMGLVGDADELVGWRFDRVVRAREPVAA